MLRIVRILAPNPGVYTLEGTNTWVVGEDPAVVIDPGPDDPEHLYRVTHEAGEVSTILLSHDHEDHAAGAALLSEATGAPVLAFRPPAGGIQMRDGHELRVGGATLQAIHAPGHTHDSMVFFVRQVSALFTGDSVMGSGTSMIDPPEGDLVNYLRSLRRMQELRSRVIYPGHGSVVYDAQGKLEEYVAHRGLREQQVLASLEDGLSTIDDMVFDIYEEYPSDVYPLAARTVLAHLIKLEREGRVERFSDEDLEHWEVAGDRQCERCGAPVSGRARLCERHRLEALQERPDPAVLQDWPTPGYPEPAAEPEAVRELVGEPAPDADPGMEEEFSSLSGEAEPEPDEPDEP